MPRPAKPWYRNATNSWYARFKGKQVWLGVSGRKAKREALEAWHVLLTNGKPKPEAVKPEASVQAVVIAFLADAEARVSAGCLRNYRLFLLPFAERYGKRSAESIATAEAEAFARKPEWSASYRNGMLGALVTAFRWAERSQLIARNPLQGVRKPPKASRGAKALVDADAYAKLCAHAEPLFKAFLRLLWLTGARPGEIASLQAEAIDLAQGVAMLSEHKTAHLGKSRILFLCPKALAVVKERLAERPQGLLFPGHDGKRMTAQAVGCRLRRLCVKASVPHSIPYGFRHSFGTDALASGVPDATVAALMGHTGTAMLHKHYAHLTARSQTLRDALAQLRRG